MFGARDGSLAEYVCVSNAVVRKPAGVSFEEAAATPLGGTTALQALRGTCKVQPGERVLIQGASGGVGTFAVQIAKWLGAEVTAVCSTPNVERARSLGADRVIDYTREDFTRGESAMTSSSTTPARGRGGSSSGCWRRRRESCSSAGRSRIGSSGRSATWSLCGRARCWAGPQALSFLAKFKREDMQVLADLLESRTIVPVVDRRFELADAAEALRYQGEGHPEGKVVVTVAN